MQDRGKTTANWSETQQAVYLQWSDSQASGQASFPSTGVEFSFDDRPSQPARIAIGDVDGDGDLDVVVAEANWNRWYANDGDDTPFSDAVEVRIGRMGNVDYSVALGDLDGDGDLDIVFGNYSPFDVSRWFENTGGSVLFDPVGPGLPIGTDQDYTTSVAIADIDGDGDLDVLTGNGIPVGVEHSRGRTNKWYANDGDSSPFSEVTTGTVIGTDADATKEIAVGDVDGDGDLDLLVGNHGQNKWYASDGDSTPFSEVTTGMPIGTDIEETYALALGDLDGDGDLDVVSGNYHATNKWYRNDGDMTPYSSVTSGTDIGTAESDTLSLALGDVDGDGDLDLVTGNIRPVNRLYLNDGDLTPFNSVGSGSPVDTDMDQTVGIALADMDRDGDLDIIAANFSGTHRLYLNDSAGSRNPLSASRGTLSYDVGLGMVTSSKVNCTETDIARATLSATDLTNTVDTRNTSISYFLSNNGGARWYRVTPATPFDFPSYGSDLRWKAELRSLSPLVSPQIDTIVIEENIEAPVIATAARMRDAFVALDADLDNGISFEESGFSTLAEFKAHDTNGNGRLELEELIRIANGAPSPTEAYVNFSNVQMEDGLSPATGFDTLLEGALFVSTGGIVTISPGSTSEAICILTPMTLRTSGGTVRIGAP